MNEEVLETPLTREEQERFEFLQNRIKQSQPTVLWFILDIREIRDKRLYREKYKTFQNFCTQILGRDGRTIREQLQALEIGDEILKAAAPPLLQNPENEKVVRESSAKVLFEASKIKAEKRLETILEAKRIAGLKNVTPKHVKEAVAKLAHRPAPKQPPLNGFEALYGAPAPAVSAPCIGDPGPMPSAAKSSTGNTVVRHAVTGQVGEWPPQPKPAAANGARHCVALGGLTLDGFRAALLRLRVPGTARIVFADAAGITRVERMNYNPEMDQLTIE